jgi:hypothetical protein
MYSCNKCGKEFNFQSEFNRHNNRKIPCDISKPYLQCDLCNVKFVRPAEKLRHEETRKHIDNIKIMFHEKNDFNNNNSLENINNELKYIISDLKKTINDLENKIEHLEIENQNLKNDKKLHPDYESIYIIHSAQHVNTNIYKIGRTDNINARRTNYPNGSDLLYSFSCKDAKAVENLILDYLKGDTKTFKLMDFGREYFQCNLKDLRNAILKFID